MMGAPNPPTPEVQRRMSAQRRGDTAPEIRLRKALFKVGLRYRCALPVPGRARRTIDIAFTKQRVAVFVDGCFWHGCPDHFVPPKANATWWREKIAGNRQRDVDTTSVLQDQGWRVVRVWEHTPSDHAVRVIRDALESAKSADVEAP